MSTTGTAEPDTYTDMELFLLHDMEFEVPCDGRPGLTECDKAVQWEGLVSCGCTRLWCDDHLKRVQELLAEEPYTVNCCTCRLRTGSWTEVTLLFVQPKTRGH